MLSLNKNSFYVTTAPPDVNRQLLQYKVYCSLFIALKRIGKIYITAIVFYLIRRFKKMRFVETIFVIMFYMAIIAPEYHGNKITFVLTAYKTRKKTSSNDGV